MIFHSEFLKLNKRVVIALRFVESIEFPEEDDDQRIIDTLKADLGLKIVMGSGKEYFLSVSEISKQYPFREKETLRELRNAIFEKWLHLLGK